MSVHVPSLCVAILIAAAEVTMLRGPAGKPAAPHKMSSPSWSLCMSNVWCRQASQGAGVKGRVTWKCM